MFESFFDDQKIRRVKQLAEYIRPKMKVPECMIYFMEDKGFCLMPRYAELEGKQTKITTGSPLFFMAIIISLFHPRNSDLLKTLVGRMGKDFQNFIDLKDKDPAFRREVERMEDSDGPFRFL